jgi:hypothetical protein
MDKKYRIIPASSSVYLFLIGFGIFVIVIGVITFTHSGNDVVALAVSAVILIGVAGLFLFFGYQARNAVFIVSDRGIKIGPGLYGRFIPREKIEVNGVAFLNLNMQQEYRPKWRMNGAGLPGYSVGWFKLNNKEKSLLFLTEVSNVVYIPTTDNYSILLSVIEADDMISRIRAWK